MIIKLFLDSDHDSTLLQVHSTVSHDSLRNIDLFEFFFRTSTFFVSSKTPTLQNNADKMSFLFLNKKSMKPFPKN